MKGRTQPKSIRKWGAHEGIWAYKSNKAMETTT